ncbi:hypothetical protein E4U31_006271 [Claviceps sp. LM219 group G6]|nr:hypothetical protein E4U31_006271 [Claviceps sp. LM219 group G6]
MSHDTGTWSVRRPRETLGGIVPNTGIPPPGSTMKRTNSNVNGHARSVSGSRQSLAMPRPSQPLFQRTSSGTSLADQGLSSVRRASIHPKAASNNVLQTPAMSRVSTDADRRSSFRPRQSIVGGTSYRQSFFQTTLQPAGVPKDPRPLKDRSFQQRMGQELMEYMTLNDFEMQMGHVLSPNVMKSPTQKDFNYMFQWLYHRIDPSHKFLKNIDQEVPPILKQLRYPFERSITKSQLAAVGGQNWSTFLGLLHWMMQLAQMLDGYVGNAYADACLEAGVDVSYDHIIFKFLSSTYRDWLAQDDRISKKEADQMLASHVEVMAQDFEQSNAKYVSELEVLEAENARLLEEIEELEESAPRVDKLDETCSAYEGDIVKFEDYMTLAQQRSEKYEGRATRLQEELEKLTEELKEAEEERRGLQKAVDAQGISMQDIDRMNSERDRLQKGTESASQRLDEIKKRVAEKESEASCKLDELERLVEKYNTLAYQIAVIPPTAANARGRNYELQLTINEDSEFTSTNLNASRNMSPSAERLLVDATTGYQPGHILNLDLRGQVRSNFLMLRKEISERRNAAMEVMMKDHDLLDGIKEAIEDKRNEVEALEHRVRAAEEEYEKTKEVTTAQKMASDAQIEKMEKKLSRMRATLTESVQLLEQRDINTKIEYEQLVLRANSLREELHTEISRMLNDIIKFKIHVQKNLEDYAIFVTDELEKELGVEGERDDTRIMDLS